MEFQVIIIATDKPYEIFPFCRYLHMPGFVKHLPLFFLIGNLYRIDIFIDSFLRICAIEVIVSDQWWYAPREAVYRLSFGVTLPEPSWTHFLSACALLPYISADISCTSRVATKHLPKRFFPVMWKKRSIYFYRSFISKSAQGLAHLFCIVFGT